jgi:hypothetical protein
MRYDQNQLKRILNKADNVFEYITYSLNTQTKI